MNDTLNSPVTQVYTFPIPGGPHLLYALDAEDTDLAEHDNWYACIAPNGSFYAARTIMTATGPRIELLHKLVYARKTNGNPERHSFIVSVNGDLLNCSRENVTTIGPREYFRSRREDITRRMTGVQWRQKHQKWRAQIVINGKRKKLGYFDFLEDAHDALEDAQALIAGAE